jgi:hypothetical protein
MMTAVEQTAAGMIRITSGWIILRPNGARLDDHLYPSEAAAKATAKCFARGHSVAPAKRVWTIHRRKPDWIIGEAS